MNAKAALALVVFLGGAALYQASTWWERAYATFKGSELSPDGCIRIDTYEPFWITPSIFHRIPHPDPGIRNDLGMIWSVAVFRRAYEVSNGNFLGETVVYDPVAAFDITLWNTSRKPGRRTVLANGFPLVDSDRCADPATLAKLEAYHERRREKNRVMRKAWEAEQSDVNRSSDSRQ
jgi:hypothetical protein